MTRSRVELREEILAFSRRELNPGAAERDRDQCFSLDLWRECGKLRLQGLLVPEEYGGLGLNPLEATYALEALGYGCKDTGLAFAICAHLLACVVPVWKHGTEQQKRRYLPGLSDGTIVAANAMSEPASGSDAFAIATVAHPNELAFRLDGRKKFVSNGPVSDLILAYAATDAVTGFHGGVTAFLIPSDTPGVVCGARVDKMSLRSCQMGDIIFEGAQVPPEFILGRKGGGGPIFAESMEWERVCLGAIHVGAMQRILEDCVGYARTRTSSGRPIGKYQAVSHRLADMKVRLEAARELTYKAASMLGRAREVGLSASIAKLFVSESLLTSATDAVRVLGGYGIMETGDADRVFRDAIAATIYSGTSDIQRNIIAKWLGL